ncbi:MAG: hypothetical protein RLZZ383_139 [Pseudomonadota bacterium]|jgi:hypothetical protein
MLALLFALHHAFSAEDSTAVLEFRCKLDRDRGWFSRGLISMTDDALVVETRRVFSVETFGIEYSRIHADFHSITRVFKTSLRIGELDGEPLVFLCPKSEGKRFTDAMKAKLLKRKRVRDIDVPPRERKRTLTLSVSDDA